MVALRFTVGNQNSTLAWMVREATGWLVPALVIFPFLLRNFHIFEEIKNAVNAFSKYGSAVDEGRCSQEFDLAQKEV